ncbi:MAG: hypothetical protein AAFY73_15545, partial [Pseudomonadota bacterium]
IARVPAFGEVGIKKVYNGAICYTPDGWRRPERVASASLPYAGAAATALHQPIAAPLFWR